jgi:hypothetical protein
VGSTPTRSISYYEETTVLKLACFRQLSDRMLIFYTILFLRLCIAGLCKKQSDAIVKEEIIFCWFA